jgi:hypothetical protein
MNTDDLTNAFMIAGGVNDPLTTAFLSLLTLKRPAGSLGELTAHTHLYAHLAHLTPITDEMGNLFVDLRGSTGSKVLFSSHYDSAHHQLPIGGDYTNKVQVTQDGNLQGVDSCIGADDAAGIYVMLRLIAAKVPALYIFHAAEEVGCIGSHYIVTKTPEVLEGITHAVAFDRRGTTDVIYEQGVESCASEGCAGVIAWMLNQKNPNLAYTPSNEGILTDTKLYRDIIPECFNISVGYSNEHTASETQDLKHLLALADAACDIDWLSLPVFRDPNVCRYYTSDSWGDMWSTINSKPTAALVLAKTWQERYDLLGLYDFLENAYYTVNLSETFMIETVWDVDPLDTDTVSAALNTLLEFLEYHYPLTG